MNNSIYAELKNSELRLRKLNSEIEEIKNQIQEKQNTLNPNKEFVKETLKEIFTKA